ncbi:tryptase-related [Holotrichia oblita]|nr:tryptase-related [Holotrichia oblita]
MSHVRNVIRIVYMILIINLCEGQLIDKNRKIPDECGLVTTSDRIINGLNATLGQFPFMALLGYTRNVFQVNLVQFVCGGTIITEEYILTAAHCFGVTLTFVRLGELDTRNNTDCVDVDGIVECGEPFIDIYIENKIIHSDFNSDNFKNDIALIKVAKKIKFTDYVQPICLPFNVDIDLEQSPLIVSGWGTTTTSTSMSSSLLQYALINTWQTKICNNLLSPAIRPLTETQICGNGKNGQDACRGDSGGPLFAVESIDFRLRYFQIGVVSFGATSGCGDPNLPSVYTDIRKYLN